MTKTLLCTYVHFEVRFISEISLCAMLGIKLIHNKYYIVVKKPNTKQDVGVVQHGDSTIITLLHVNHDLIHLTNYCTHFVQVRSLIR